MNGFEAYCLFNSINLHFSKDSYDAFKYNFAWKGKRETFENRKDRFQYQKMTKMFPKSEQLKLYFVDNIMNDHKWIGSMSNDVYLKGEGRRQSLSYGFSKDLQTITENSHKYHLTFDEALLPNSTKDDSLILSLLNGNQIEIESVVILNSLVNFVPRLRKELSDPLGMTETTLRKIQKYSPFIERDIQRNKPKYKDLIISAFTNQPK